MSINAIENIENINKSQIKKVTDICFHGQNIRHLPYQLINFINVKNLYLENNNLRILSKEIKLLVNLEVLTLNNNELESIPNELCLLKNLVKLTLHCNNLKELPEEIDNLTNLKILTLSDNQLIALPRGLGKLTKLISLNLYSNNLASLPIEIKNIQKLYLGHSSYENFDNLSCNCEYLNITNLKKPLLNLPINLMELHLTDPLTTNIKLPHGCKLYIGGKLKNETLIDPDLPKYKFIKNLFKFTNKSNRASFS